MAQKIGMSRLCTKSSPEQMFITAALGFELGSKFEIG
jgi:hypothetical protein